MMYLITIGKDPRQYPHTQAAASKLEHMPTVEEAERQLQLKTTKSDKEWANNKRQKRRMQ